ncbi:GerAB/ArcD/ProY family transporter [Sporolactobacillus inulinus]|uniref:GerAB/ArcD/ProY family transporter n=1 Tax=Sporolactobacillus inulinus TaxID=2078 RepID=UPI0021CC6E76|nr:GerAB/ArcD/ProY family transporter [Sporolactobacillus inulinus]
MYAIRQGIEVLVRCAVLFAPLILGIHLLICILIIPELSPYRLLPLLDHGLLAPLQGTLAPIVWFSQFIWCAFYMPAVDVPAKKMFVSGCWFVLATTVALLIIFAVVISFLGDATVQYLYPFDMVERYVQITGILERSSVLFMIVWLLGIFVKVASLLFILNLAVAQTGRGMRYRKTSIPVTVVFFLIVLALFPTNESLQHEGRLVLYLCSVAGNLVIPLLLVIFLLIFRKAKGKTRMQS